MVAGAVQITKPGGKAPVLVKGVKNGFLFLLDEQCTFDTLMEHLDGLLDNELSAVFDEPAVSVFVDYGERELSAEQTRSVFNLFMTKGNFVIREWGSHTSARRSLLASRGPLLSQSIFKGTVRSGQRLTFEGDVVIIGDVNPGGEVVSTGDIYVFGRLAGIAHAGLQGDEKAIIAAADFCPLQLRIADSVSRPPEVDGRSMRTFMEFAYLGPEGMAVDRMQFLHSFRVKD